MAKSDIFDFTKIYKNDAINKDLLEDYIDNSVIQTEKCNIYASGDIHGDYHLFIHILLE